jgi:predicted nucleotidyltransferase
VYNIFHIYYRFFLWEGVMKVAGIIAEYNPFHNGHAWQLAAARALGAQRVVVAMSSGLVQRGALPLLPDAVRARAAVEAEHGADLVFALPAFYACSGAEAFARAGVRLLAAAGCDTLLFGAETADIARLQRAAQVLASEEYRAALRAQLDGPARSFAAARQAAVEALCPGENLSDVLSRPNNNLAVEYCKAILELGVPMTPVALPRTGAGHDDALPAESSAPAAPEAFKAPDAGAACFASASALRALWLGERPKEKELWALAPYVPASALALYRAAEAEGRVLDPAAADTAVLALLRMRARTSDAFAGTRGASEGLEHRLAAAVREAASLDELADALTTVRYPRARMRRLILNAALGWREGTCPALPPALHLLAARRDALPLLAACTLPVSPSLARLAQESDDCRRVAEAQAAAVDLGALCLRRAAPMGLAYTQKPYFAPEGGPALGNA